MKISGTILAENYREKIIKEIRFLKEHNVIPHLAIVKTLHIPQVDNYIRQKVKAGDLIGVRVTVHDLTNSNISKEEIYKLIKELNNNEMVHGIILQKPSRDDIDENAEKLISIKKDVDAFLPNSPYSPPVFKAVEYILQQIYGQQWRNEKIVIVGKGKTGGGSIISGLKKVNIQNYEIIDTQTEEKKREDLIKNAEIVISAVGIHTPINTNWLHKPQILIDVGVHFIDDKIKGDFDEDEIRDKVSYYTTTPGGVGPLTVAGLLENVVESAHIV